MRLAEGIQEYLYTFTPKPQMTGRIQNTGIRIGCNDILVNLDDAPKVERIYRSGDLHHERAQRATVDARSGSLARTA